MGTCSALLGVIWVDSEVRKEEGFAARPLAATVWFYRYKDGIDLFERFRIFGFDDPTLIGHVVFVQNTEAQRLVLTRASPAPDLKRTRIF